MKGNTLAGSIQKKHAYESVLFSAHHPVTQFYLVHIIHCYSVLFSAHHPLFYLVHIIHCYSVLFSAHSLLVLFSAHHPLLLT